MSSTLPSSIYEAVFLRSPSGGYLLSTTPEATILAVNDAFLASSGRRREELVGASLFEVFSANPDDREDSGISALKASLAKVVETGRSDTLALQRYPIKVTSAGTEHFEERYWSAVNTPICDADGNLLCIAHSTIDVTDLVTDKVAAPSSAVEPASFDDVDERTHRAAGIFTHAQALHEVTKALEGERSRLRHLFEHSPGFVYFTSGPLHVIEQANKALFDLVGRREVIGKTVREAFPEVIGQGFLEMHDQVYQSGKPIIVREGRVMLRRSPDLPAVERFVDLVYQPITNPDGEVIGISGQGNDITEQVRAEREVREGSRRKDEFLAMLAHELRNPLAPISAAAELLARRPLDDSTLIQTSQIVQRQVRHMRGLVDDLLDVSRVTRGLISVDKDPQDIKQIVAEAVEQVQPTIEAKHHTLAINLTPEIAYVCGDQKRLIQILTNLLSNAAKYTPPSGNIELRVEANATEVKLRVIDDGLGISSELQPHIFDLFVQADRSADRSQGGLGLGLALVKSLVELHDGYVNCFSGGAGHGSCFTVCLPRFAHEATARRLEPGPSASALPRELGKILLVDDNVDAAQTLGMLLRFGGHEVLVEYTAEQAIERARTECPDVCVLDIGLPDMDGASLARHLRSQPGTERAVFIAVTGYGQADERRFAVDQVFDHYLVKPVEADTLLSLIATATISDR